MFKEATHPRRRMFLLVAGLLALLGLLVLASWWWRDWNAVALGPQRTVQTLNPKVGIHTRLTDEVEPWKIKRTWEMVREMGAPWAVEYFPWAYVEERPGRQDWAHSDLVMDHAARQGVKVIARLGFVPEWARPKETTPLYLDEEHFADFGRYAAAFVARYADTIDHVVIWNEPNLALEWGFQPPDPVKYTEMLRVVYPMIKAANPNVQVLAGALAPTNAPAGSTDAVNDLDFLRAMYAAGAAPYFDMLAIHAYGWHSDPDDPADPAAINFRRAELMRTIMVENGDAAKQAMITEGGWNDHHAGRAPSSPPSASTTPCVPMLSPTKSGPGSMRSRCGSSVFRGTQSLTRITTPLSAPISSRSPSISRSSPQWRVNPRTRRSRPSRRRKPPKAGSREPAQMGVGRTCGTSACRAGERRLVVRGRRSTHLACAA